MQNSVKSPFNVGKLGATDDFIFPSELLRKIWKNFWWFIITKHTSINFFECLKALESYGKRKRITNCRFFLMLFKWENGGLWRRSKTVDFGHSNYESVMFFSQTYHLSTSRRVKLESRNNERPNGKFFTVNCSNKFFFRFEAGRLLVWYYS